MPSPAAAGMVLETAFIRRVATAAEIVDSVTLRPVTRGITVRAVGLKRPPIVNGSGFYVWTEEAGPGASQIVVDPAASPFEPAQAPSIPPPGWCRIELTPTPGYRFPQGVTAFRGTLRESLYGPPVPVAGALIRLQWEDDGVWTDAPVASRSAANGDFAATLRLLPAAEPRLLTDGALAVRFLVERDGATRISTEFPLRQGTVGAGATPFIWDELAS